MRRSSVFVVGVVAAASLLVGTLAAGAQGTPDAAPAVQPIVPAPNQCRVEPRDIAFFQQFVATPDAMGSPAGVASPAAEGTPADMAAFQMPEGEPADRATRAAVLDTVRQAAACINAGNFLALFALYTDDYFHRTAEAEGPLTEEDFAFFAAEPEPLPAGGQVAILGVLDIRVLPDGRVAVLVDYLDPFEGTPFPARILFILVEQDGRWLIDEEIELGPIEPSQVGTPPA